MSTHPYLAYSDLGGAPAGQFRDRELQQLSFQNAKRVQEAITASAEKRLLIWLARRMPAWVNPDHLTALGATAQFLAGVSYGLARFSPRWLVATNFFIALNWFGDSLDGTLARVREQQRPRYGFYVDHVIDTFGAFFLMTGLALSGYLHWQVAMAMLVAFLMFSVEVYLATYTLGRFQLSYSRLGPTEIRIALMVGNIVLMFHPHATLFGRRFLLFDVGGVIATAVMGAMLVVSAVRHTAQLYREERLP